MSSTRLFRTQHEELGRLMAELRTHLRPGPPGKGAFDAFQAFAEKLKAHLALEDRGLYPQLLNHPHDQVRLTAQIYQAEMGNLGQEFGTLEARWASVARLEADPAGFAREVEALFERVERRISREDHGLYALVDRLE